MFGMKKQKRYSFKDTFKKKLQESIKNEEYRGDTPPVYVDHSLDGIPLLHNGQRNVSISTQILHQLPLHLQRFSYWSVIDLEKYFEEPPEEIETIESPDNPLSRVSRESEKPLDVFEINENMKNKIKSIVLGELSNQKKEGGD